MRCLLEIRGERAVQILPNAAFGYWKVTVERPLRLKGIDPERLFGQGDWELRETAER